ncbi:hypothetical protein Q8F55_006359 [Vanrija albida]|uniref:Uncharacterized protein n=1 Tax=Vanrija albida TaxID=181172 RepID=A0ABR3PWV1_9TREE
MSTPTPPAVNPVPAQKEEFIEAIKAASDEDFSRNLAVGAKMAKDIRRLGDGAYPLAVTLEELALLLEHRIAKVRDGGDEENDDYIEYATRLGDLLPAVVEAMSRPRVQQLSLLEVMLVRQNLRHALQ